MSGFKVDSYGQPKRLKSHFMRQNRITLWIMTSKASLRSKKVKCVGMDKNGLLLIWDWYIDQLNDGNCGLFYDF